MFSIPAFRSSPLMLAMAIGVSSLAIPVLSQAAPATDKPAAAVSPAATRATNTSDATKAAGQQSLKSKARAADNEALKLSQEGYQTMRDIRLARISIFDGDTQGAKDLLTQATQALDAVDQTAVKATSDVKADLLPIDGEIIVSDNFIDTPVKRQHIGKANAHLKQGHATMARDELRLAEVDASFSRILMPVDATRRHLNAAATLIRSDQFYEANMALKAAEDGLLVDTVSISEVPVANANK